MLFAAAAATLGALFAGGSASAATTQTAHPDSGVTGACAADTFEFDNYSSGSVYCLLPNETITVDQEVGTTAYAYNGTSVDAFVYYTVNGAVHGIKQEIAPGRSLTLSKPDYVVTLRVAASS